MKLPIPFLLYTTSLGLCGFAGWEVYQLLPLQKKETREAATRLGMKQATDHLSVGGRKSETGADWSYTPANRDWWLSFDEANFIGKLPPPPPEPPKEGDKEKEKPKAPVVPLENIIELVSLVYDSQDDGAGELSHVIVRYKPEANVQPPEWYVRESAAAATSNTASPGDRTPPPRRPGGNQGFQGRNNRGAQRPQDPQPSAPAPTAMPSQGDASREVLQKVWIQGVGDPRRDPHLWPPFENIRLVRVAPTATSAFFVRGKPPTSGDGNETEKPKEEELIKTTTGIPQEVLRDLALLNGQPDPGAVAKPANPSAPSAWTEMDETKFLGKVCNIGRKDEALFGQDDSIYEKAYVDTWQSKQTPGKKGLMFKNVDTALGAKFGISNGEVLLSVNNRAVQSKADAIQFGKQEYKKGVRTFVTVWLSNGQEIERIYQAPDK